MFVTRLMEVLYLTVNIFYLNGKAATGPNEISTF